MKHGIFELPLNLKRSHFSYAHTDDDVDRLLEATEAAVTTVLGRAVSTARSPARSTSPRRGKQVGRLQLPEDLEHGRAGRTSFVPIATIANGDGPTVLVLAGNHGDEYEGQVAALRLIQRARSPSRCTAG